jgi:propanediol dehydratase small subunit
MRRQNGPIAEGYPQLARNFRRAAELTAIPATVLLATYTTSCSPNRAQLRRTAGDGARGYCARYDAPETGDYIREAAEAYRTKGLVRD